MMRLSLCILVLCATELPHNTAAFTATSSSPSSSSSSSLSSSLLGASRRTIWNNVVTTNNVHRNPTQVSMIWFGNHDDARSFAVVASRKNDRRARQKKSHTAVSMGIRSFITNRILGKEEDDKKNNVKEEKRRIKKKKGRGKIGDTVVTPPPPPQSSSSFGVNIPAMDGADLGEEDSAVVVEEPWLTDNDRGDNEGGNFRTSGDASTGTSTTTTGSGGGYYGESIQERIRRVKSGSMSEEEKAAFLNAALTRVVSPSSSSKNKDGGSGPIRQEIPDASDEEGDGSSSKQKRKSWRRGEPSSSTSSRTPSFTPAPFPSDSLWSTVIGKGRSPPDGKDKTKSASGRTGRGRDLDDAAKREWFEMVTSPDRFRTYSVSASGERTISPIASPVSPPTTAADDDDDASSSSPAFLDEEEAQQATLRSIEDAKKQLIEEQQMYASGRVRSGGGGGATYTPKKVPKSTQPQEVEKGEEKEDDMVLDEHESDTDVTGKEENAEDTSDTPEKIVGDLASRLGAAAMLKEQRDAELKRKLELERQEEQRRLAELQRRREEELRRREEEIAARKKAEREARERMEQERKIAEERRRKELEAAQDAYWQKKLAEERARKEAKLSAEERADRERLQAEQEERERARKEREAERDMERRRLKEEERLREDQHEGEILKETEEEKLHDREMTWEIMEKSAAEAVGQKGPDLSKKTPPDVSVSSFVKEQAKKKAELDRMLEQQRMQLKSLNSPIPSRSGGVRASPPTASPVMQQRRGASPSRTSSGRALANLAGMVNKKEEDDSSEQDSGAPSPQALEPSQPVRLSLSEMTRLKKDTAESRNEPSDEEKSTPSATETSEPAKKRPIRQQIFSPGSKATLAATEEQSTKRAVRQKLPLSDEEFFSPTGPNKNMSIGEAMRRVKEKTGDTSDDKKEAERKKSKMWGVDIDKIL